MSVEILLVPYVTALMVIIIIFFSLFTILFIMGYQYLIFLVDLGLLFINVVDNSVVYRVNDGLQNTRHSKSSFLVELAKGGSAINGATRYSLFICM